MDREHLLETLCKAIKGRRSVAIHLLGDDEARTCHPHILYESGTGRLLIEGAQTGGASTSGRSTIWRSFDVDRVEELQIQDDVFQPQVSFNPLNRERYARPMCWIGQLRAVRSAE